MPTKTKPKLPAIVHMIPVRFTEDESVEIINLLGADSKSSEEQAALVADLEQYLTYEFNRLFKLPDRPMPAHVISEISAIISAAKILANKIHPMRLTSEASKIFVGIDIGKLWYNLIYLESGADLAITNLKARKSKSDGGALNKRDSELRADTKENLRQFFDNQMRTVADKSYSLKEYRDDFIDICMNKMPVPPSRRRKKNNPL